MALADVDNIALGASRTSSSSSENSIDDFGDEAEIGAIFNFFDGGGGGGSSPEHHCPQHMADLYHAFCGQSCPLIQNTETFFSAHQF